MIFSASSAVGCVCTELVYSPVCVQSVYDKSQEEEDQQKTTNYKLQCRYYSKDTETVFRFKIDLIV